MNRKIILISIAGLSMLIIGMERTLGCVLGSTLAILVNGMLAGRPSDGGPSGPEKPSAPRETHRDVGADSWKTPAIRKTTAMTIGVQT